MTDGNQSQQTQWPIVWVAFGAGIVAATHIGKLPPALPEIRLALDAGLITGGWIASMISCTGFALGLVAGVLVDDAIVEIENIVRHMRMGKTAYQASIDAADEIGLPVVATDGGTMALSM